MSLELTWTSNVSSAESFVRTRVNNELEVARHHNSTSVGWSLEFELLSKLILDTGREQSL